MATQPAPDSPVGGERRPVAERERSAAGSLSLVFLAAVLGGCAGSGQTVALDVVPKLPPAQSVASDPVKIVIEPFEDLRADTTRLGLRTHLGGGVTYFNVTGGKAGETVAEALAETLRQRGWQGKGWDARVVQAGVAVSGADIVLTGQLLDLASNAKSRFFSTVLSAESKMVIKAFNVRDGSSTTRNVEGALTQTVFWFEHDDVRKLVALALKDGIDRFIHDTKIDGGTLKSVR